MTGVLRVSPDWLALREPEDARARSTSLAAGAATLVTGTGVVHDLGSGTGSMMRWLAPRLPGPQHWVLHDRQADLVETAAAALPPHDPDGRPITIETRIGELADLSSEELVGAALVTASALLDVLTAAEATTIADACIAAGVPALLALNVTGEVRLDPPDPRDERIRTAFNAHQRRTDGGRTLLGPEAAVVVAARFRAAGWHVREDRTRWCLGPHDPELLAEWFDGRVGAALEQEPDLTACGRDLQTDRGARLRAGTLSAVVEHVDLLAWPA